MELPRTLLLSVTVQATIFFQVMQGDSNLWSTWWSYHGISVTMWPLWWLGIVLMRHIVGTFYHLRFDPKFAYAMGRAQMPILDYGSSGPDYWGLVNQDWILCSKGRYQSPVDISPRILVYDPSLRPLRLDNHRVDGHLINTGNDITYQVDPNFNPPFLLTGGPLSYTYRIHYIKLHFGTMDQIGSEHTVAGRPFPLELQFFAFNHDLYTNFSQASKAAHGIAAIAVFGMIGEEGNKEFDILVQASSQVKFRGHNLSFAGISVPGLLPETRDFMTYEGSLTQPGCQETVTWIIFNKPVYVTKDEVSALRQLHEAPEGSPEMLMENNFRPTMALNRRTIRTNIPPEEMEPHCGIKKITFYEVNDRYRVT